MPLDPSGVPSRAAIQAAIDETVVDTGWVSLETSVTGATAAYRARGDVVQIVVGGSFSLDHATNTTIVAAGLIPAQYRQTRASGLWATLYLAGTLAGIGVNPDGAIVARQNSGATVSGSAGGTMTYLAD